MHLSGLIWLSLDFASRILDFICSHTDFKSWWLDVQSSANTADTLKAHAKMLKSSIVMSLTDNVKQYSIFSCWDRCSVWVKRQCGYTGLHEFTLGVFRLKFCHPQAGVSHSQMMKEQQKAEFIAELASAEPGDAACSWETTTTEMENWNGVVIGDGWENIGCGDKVLLKGPGIFAPMGVWREAKNFSSILWRICV